MNFDKQIELLERRIERLEMERDKISKDFLLYICHEWEDGQLPFIPAQNFRDLADDMDTKQNEINGIRDAIKILKAYEE